MIEACKEGEESHSGESGNNISLCENPHDVIHFSMSTSCSADLESSLESIPILAQTPRVFDGIETPNTSQCSINPDISNDIEALKAENTSTQNILLDAGYDLSEVKAITSHNHRENHNDGKNGRSRPQTQVFWQGKAFTYEKLITEPPKINKKHISNLISSKDLSLEVDNQAPSVHLRTASSPTVTLSNENPDQLGTNAFTILKNLRVQTVRRYNTRNTDTCPYWQESV